MASEVFELALLLSLKDQASGGLNRFTAELRTADKQGKLTADTMDSLRSEMNKGFAIAGTGIAGLALVGKGVKVAGDFQSSMTDLRATLSKTGKDGKVDLTAVSYTHLTLPTTPYV